MRIIFYLIITAMISVSSASAEDWCDSAMPIKNIDFNRNKLVGKIITIGRIYCGDVPSGFLCSASDMNSAVHYAVNVDAIILGAYTSQAIAENLTGPCKGEFSRIKPECLVSTQMQVTSYQREVLTFNGTKSIVYTLRGRSIEMQSPCPIQ